jgi:AcrR family transcriptional regulator
MSSLITKEKIIDSAVKLFNRDGLVNVRLQHIADEAFMSIGNMTYHYRTKELIVQAIWEQLVKKQHELLAEYRIVPLFEDIERQIRSMFELQQKYIFFYLDTLEVIRAFPEIQRAHSQHIEWQVLQVKTMLQFNVSRGAFERENTEGYHHKLAQQYWLTSDMWLYRQKIMALSTQDFDAYRDALWALLMPNFTAMGQQEFRQLNDLISQNLLYL